MNIVDVLFAVLIIITAILIAIIMIGKQQRQTPAPGNTFRKKFVGILRAAWQNSKKIKGGVIIMARKVWQNNFLFAVFFATIMVIVFLLFHFFILPKIPKLSPFELAKIFFVIILFVCVVISGIIIAAVKVYSDSKNKEGISGSIIRNIPSNQVWVLRNAWFSDPGSIENKEITDSTGKKTTVTIEKEPPKGYRAKPEGWRFYIPYLWHIDMGLVDLAPKARDPEDLTKINTSDNQTAEIDWQIETVIDDSVKFIVRAKNEQGRETFEDQKIKAILAHICSGKTQKDLTNFKENDLKEMSKNVLEQFNQAIAIFGIKAISLDIKKIIMPEEIRDAAEYKTVTKQRLDAANNKGKELQRIIGKTGANPTVTVAADIVRGGLTDLVELIESFKKKGGN